MLSQDGESPVPLPSANGHPNGNGGGSDWLTDGRWKALRRLGSTSGWLIDPTEVSLGKVRRRGAARACNRVQHRLIC